MLGFGERHVASLLTIAAAHGHLVRTCAVDATGGLADPGGHARRSYGISGDTLVLVRPDGHVALSDDDPAPVLAYLAGLA